ncbi:probable cytochrome P450 305a1 [Lutzomyia longipalpis]|uniref:probable cytochrome P450 305a1 n=1 Tax=Lutzomyia longipalpis TaxID=7200 RepID=UPI002483B979|nr:probable cytochrome P450 305a1 [Lutzomyia longipalpis]
MQGLIEKELSAFKEVIQEEMTREGSLWPGEFLKESVMNVLWTIVAGNDAEHRVLSKTLMNLLEKRLKNFDISGGALSDFPWLRFAAPEYSGYNLLCQINKEITSILKKIIAVHQERFSEEKANENLIYAFIEEMRKQETKEGSTFTEKQLMVVMMDFIIGGSYSTRATFDLSLMTLALYPDIQEEIHAEIAKATPLNSSNFHSGDLPLCQAFLMEIARFYSIVPTTGPRRAFAETQLCGYTIPKDTTILIGNEFVHMDRTFWNDPEIFRPSRFLNEGKTKIINSDRVHQFGQGKRMCLGVPLAKSFLHTFLTGIVQDYRISPAPGKEPPSQNLIPGLFKTIKPYQVQFIRRF